MSKTRSKTRSNTAIARERNGVGEAQYGYYNVAAPGDEEDWRPELSPKRLKLSDYQHPDGTPKRVQKKAPRKWHGDFLKRWLWADILLYLAVLVAVLLFHLTATPNRRRPPPVIAVLGATGAGKSSFIEALGGRDGLGQKPVVCNGKYEPCKYRAALGTECWTDE